MTRGPARISPSAPPPSPRRCSSATASTCRSSRSGSPRRSSGPSEISVDPRAAARRPHLHVAAHRRPCRPAAEPRAAGALYAFLTAALFAVPIFVCRLLDDPLLHRRRADVLERARPLHRGGDPLRRARAWDRLCAGAALGVGGLHDGKPRSRPPRCSASPATPCSSSSSPPISPAALVALLSPRVPAPPPAAEKFGLKKAFADPTLRRALIAGTLVLGAHGVFYTFGTLYWQSQGLQRRADRRALGLQRRRRGRRCSGW